ncbi:MAG: hypothetical protein V4713_04990 [Pseudomonadota bacterium]
MKRLVSAIASLFLAISVHSQDVIAPEYVSIDCPAGDISLQLKPDHTFVLVLKHWDAKAQTHSKTETLDGSWSYTGDILVLKSRGNISYRRSKASMKVGDKAAEIDSFAWQSSAGPTFADRYMLVERVAVDSLFKSAIPIR